MAATIDEHTIEAEMREQAHREGVPVSEFATATTTKLTDAFQRAEGITDQEARDLLIYSALENAIPELIKFLGTDSEARDLYGSSILLFIVLGVAFFLSKNKQDDHTDKTLENLTIKPRRSIMDFAGIGKGQPGAVEGGVQEYINSLRDEWDERDADLDQYRAKSRTAVIGSDYPDAA